MAVGVVGLQLSPVARSTTASCGGSEPTLAGDVPPSRSCSSCSCPVSASMSRVRADGSASRPVSPPAIGVDEVGADRIRSRPDHPPAGRRGHQPTHHGPDPSDHRLCRPADCGAARHGYRHRSRVHRPCHVVRFGGKSRSGLQDPRGLGGPGRGGSRGIALPTRATARSRSRRAHSSGVGLSGDAVIDRAGVGPPGRRRSGRRTGAVGISPQRPDRLHLLGHRRGVGFRRGGIGPAAPGGLRVVRHTGGHTVSGTGSEESWQSA